MPRRRMTRRSARGSRGFRPGTDWAAATVVGTLTADLTGHDQDTWDLTAVTGVDVNALDPETVRRIRGRWLTWATSLPTAAPGIREVGLGIGVANPAALAATPPAVEGPVTSSWWDGWMYRSWAVFVLPAAASNLGPSFYQSSNEAVYEIDSRAMRRLEDNHLFLTLELQTDSGQADAFEYAVDLRWLQSLSVKR